MSQLNSASCNSPRCRNLEAHLPTSFLWSSSDPQRSSEFSHSCCPPAVLWTSFSRCSSSLPMVGSLSWANRHVSAVGSWAHVAHGNRSGVHHLLPRQKKRLLSLRGTLRRILPQRRTAEAQQDVEWFLLNSYVCFSWCVIWVWKMLVIFIY